MNVSADQVRAATRQAAAVITKDSLPPLRLVELDDPSRSPNRSPNHRQRRRTQLPWLAPLLAAAAVIIVVVASVTAGTRLTRSGNGHSKGAPQNTAAEAFANVPPYYVAVENSSLAVVRATATGAVLARITTKTPFVGVAAAADDRTFVLDAQRQVMGPVVTWPGQPAFYLLKLNASGAKQSFTRLAIPALPKGVAVTGLALSPDGSKLAVEMDKDRNYSAGLLEIRVYTLATGAYHAWSTNGSDDAVDPGGFTGSGVDGSETISWAADSRTLAFDWKNQSYTGVRLLDTSASGDDLIADSRLAVIEADFTSGSRPFPQSTPPDYVSQCVTDGIISLDGSALVCGYATTVDLSKKSQDLSKDKFVTATGFIRYSTRTGKMTTVLGAYHFSGQVGGDTSLYWVNSTGNTLVGSVGTPRGIQVGVINGDTFTPLPGIRALGAAAW
jgi:hypothetical protein